MVRKEFVRQRAEYVVNCLDYDFDNFSMEDYVAWMEQSTGRQIHFLKYKLPLHITGAWFKDVTGRHDYIFIADDLSPLLEIQVKLHELAHILNNHSTVAITSEMWERIADGSLKLEKLVQFAHAVKRSTDPKTVEQEAEAEQTASLIQERINQFVRSHKLKDGSRDAETQTFLRNIGLG